MDTFAAPDGTWTTIDPAWVRLKRLMVLITWGLLTLVATLALGFAWRWWAAGLLAVALLATTAYRWWRVRRVWERWGYAEHATDLYIRRGLWHQRLTVVPYGRMQVVTVDSGPVERRFGLATVTLETASAATDATIPGLGRAAADALRDRLASRGEQQAVGL